MNGITWLASYPKSGNTWVRLFLTALLNGRRPDLSALDFSPQLAQSRAAFEHYLHLDASDLTDDEIECLRPCLTRSIANGLPGPLYIKTHDARLVNSAGEPLVPREATEAVVYLVRDPRDIAPSLAHHQGCDLDRAIEIMGDGARRTPSHRHGLHFPLGDRWSSWSMHVESWLDAQGPAPLVLRYETLLGEPHAAFTELAKHLGFASDYESVAAAIEATRFEVLQDAERQNGFAGQVVPGRTFFREGRAGGWRATLSRTQVARIEADHGPVMSRLGYLET